MYNFFIVLQFIIMLVLVVLVLLQNPDSDSLSGLGGSFNSMFSPRTSTTVVTKAIFILIVLFMINSIVLYRYHSYVSKENSILDKVQQQKHKVKKNKNIDIPF